MPRNSLAPLTLVPVRIPLSVIANGGKPAEASKAEPSVTAQNIAAAIRSPEPTPGRLSHLCAFSILSIADSSISFGARSAAANHARFHVKRSPTLVPREQLPHTLDILSAAITIFYRPIFPARDIAPCAELSRLR